MQGFRAVTILCAATAFLAIGANVLCLRCMWKARKLMDSNTRLLLNQLVLCNAASTFYFWIKTTATLVGSTWWLNRSVAECYLMEVPGYICFAGVGFWTFMMLSFERLAALKYSDTAEPSKRSKTIVQILNLFIWIYSIGSIMVVVYLAWPVLSTTIVPYCITFQLTDIPGLYLLVLGYLVAIIAFLCSILYIRAYVKQELADFMARQMSISLERRTFLERTRHFSRMMIYGMPCLLLGYIPAILYLTILQLPTSIIENDNAHMIFYQSFYGFPFCCASLIISFVFMFFNPVLRAHVPFFAGKSWNDRVMEQEHDEQNIHAIHFLNLPPPSAKT